MSTYKAYCDRHDLYYDDRGCPGCESDARGGTVKEESFEDKMDRFLAKIKGRTFLPTDPKARKGIPVATGCIDYFPKALAAVAEVSRVGNDQHNPGQPLHWDRSKSTDEADCLIRHFLERGTKDKDGLRHSAKVAWRALALLEKEIEAEQDRDRNTA